MKNFLIKNIAVLLSFFTVSFILFNNLGIKNAVSVLPSSPQAKISLTGNDNFGKKVAILGITSNEKMFMNFIGENIFTSTNIILIPDLTTLINSSLTDVMKWDILQKKQADEAEMKKNENSHSESNSAAPVASTPANQNTNNSGNTSNNSSTVSAQKANTSQNTPTAAPETKQQQNNSSNNSNNQAQPEPYTPPADSVLWSDFSAGVLTDPLHVPCGGLWQYYYPNFYARELNCPGSAAYLNLNVGQKIKINNHVCTMVGAQVLDRYTDDMGMVQWIGNTIVQTCFSNSPNVRLVNFNCS